MAGYKRSYTGGEYSVNYAMMGGVDFSSPDSISGRRRYAYLENMYRDYDGEGAELIESVPGFRKIHSFGEKIHALYFHKTKEGEEALIIHAGARVYRMPLKDFETGNQPHFLRTVNDSKSAGFSFGKNVYILDGSKIGRIDENGEMSFVSDGGGEAPYVPTTYVNGVEYEQLNLLTRKFSEELYVAFPEDIAYESAGLEYRITDKEMKKCAVTGIQNSHKGKLFIPSYTKIGGEKYAVERIDEGAFKNKSAISEITVSEGLKEIGEGAFSGASGIAEATLPDSLELIEKDAFSGASALKTVRLGREISKIGEGAFSGTALSLIKYAKGTNELSAILVGTGGEGVTISEYDKYDFITATMPVYTPSDALTELLIGEESPPFYEIFENDDVVGIVIPKIQKKLLESAVLKLRGFAHKEKYKTNSPGVNFMSETKGEEPSEAIKKCTVCECFDGRVFLSGNPEFPNTVFYSARDNTGKNNPLYFGVMNYFNDGVGDFPTVSLLASGDSLAVFKAGDDGTGSIFYHVPRETGIDILPKVYPVSYIHSGIYAQGKSKSFFDDPVFISGIGLLALDKQAINLERSIVCRSHNVNPKLLSKNLERADLAVWCGYLAFLIDGEIFLADSRAPFRHETGNMEYEWYYMSGIGTYSGDDFVYRYMESTVPECETKSELLGEVTDATVYSATSKNSKEYFYVSEAGTRYQVAKSDEKRGGGFNPATLLLGVDNRLLFFATDNGDVCIFNNDKRGIAPKRVSDSEDFDDEEYKKAMERKLHPEFYSFTGHAPRYALSTVTDDGGVHDMTKDTVKGSFVLKCKSFGTGSFKLEVKTDKRAYEELASFTDGGLNFEDLDFNSLAFSTESRMLIPIAEKEKGWCEKQISLYANDYASPIGIYAISYRFKPRGKIKKMKF